MYLLEHIQNSLGGSKHSLALQLMRKPWTCDRKLLVEYLPAKLAKQFLKLQESCKTALEAPVKKARFLQTELAGISLHAYAISIDGRGVPLDAMALHSAEQFVGQIREDLVAAGASFQELSVSMQAAFIALYMLADASLYFLTGIVASKSSSLALTVTDDAAVMRALRLYWFGHHWAFQSGVSDMFMRDFVVHAIKKKVGSIEQAVRLRLPIFITFVNASLDKFLSIHSDFSHLLKIEDQPAYAAMYRRAELISYFFLKSHEAMEGFQSNRFNPVSDISIPGDYDMEMVMQAGFTQLEVETLLAESAKKAPGDAFLLKTSSGKLGLGNINFKYACNIYLKPMLLNISSRGDWFDKEYIPAYLKKRVRNSRYSYGAGIKPKTDEEGKYDVDLIVADHETERIYLCQIKHRVATLLPYLRDELKEFSTNGQLIDATEQLNGARRQLNSSKFLEKVRDSLKRGGIATGFLAKIDTPFLQEKAGFIIVHTIENLDFGLKNGIALYEWNTFRNLLRGCTTTYSKDRVDTACLDLSGVALDDPAHVSEKLIAWHEKQAPDNPLRLDKQWALKIASYLHLFPQWELRLWGKKIYSYKGKSFRYPLL